MDEQQARHFLGIADGPFSLRDLREARNNALKAQHPDKIGSDPAAIRRSTYWTTQINVAYDLLHSRFEGQNATRQSSTNPSNPERQAPHEQAAAQARSDPASDAVEAEIRDYRNALMRSVDAGRMSHEQLDREVSDFRRLYSRLAKLATQYQLDYSKATGQINAVGWFPGYRTQPVVAMSDIKVSTGLLGRSVALSATITNATVVHLEAVEYEVIAVTHDQKIEGFQLSKCGTAASGFIYVPSHVGATKLAPWFEVVTDLEPGEARHVAWKRATGKCALVVCLAIPRRVKLTGTWSAPEPIDKADAILAWVTEKALLGKPVFA